MKCLNPTRSMHGFTLIEIMVVVAIISILATLALPKFGQFQQKARLTEAIHMVAHIKEGIELFRLENPRALFFTARRAAVGSTTINSLGLVTQLPVESHFEYTITAFGDSTVPASNANLRVTGKHPHGVSIHSLEATTVRSNEEGTQFYKLEGSTEQIPY